VELILELGILLDTFCEEVDDGRLMNETLLKERRFR